MQLVVFIYQLVLSSTSFSDEVTITKHIVFNFRKRCEALDTKTITEVIIMLLNIMFLRLKTANITRMKIFIFQVCKNVSMFKIMTSNLTTSG